MGLASSPSSFSSFYTVTGSLNKLNNNIIPSLEYLPNQDVNILNSGRGTLSVTATDLEMGSSTLTLKTHVSAVNDPPSVSSSPTYSTPEDTTLTFGPSLFVGDVDAGDGSGGYVTVTLESEDPTAVWNVGQLGGTSKTEEPGKVRSGRTGERSGAQHAEWANVTNSTLLVVSLLSSFAPPVRLPFAVPYPP